MSDGISAAASKAFLLGLSQDWASDAAARPEENTFQLLHRRRPKQKVKRPPEDYKPQQEKNLSTRHQLVFFFFRFAFDGVSKSPAACEAPVSRRKGGTCHFAQRPEPHPPDTCQAGAETPPGRPPLAPEPRLLSAPSGRSAAVGHREGPYSRRDPAPGGDAPPPRRCGARRRTLGAPFLRAARARRLGSLTWPEAGPRGRCPARGPPQEGAAGAAGAAAGAPRRRRRLLLYGGFWAA